MPRANDICDRTNLLIGSRIREMRIERGISRKDLAAMVGVTHQQFNKYESGNNRISIGRFVQVIRALGECPSEVIKDFDPFAEKCKISNTERLRLETSKQLKKIKSHEKCRILKDIVDLFLEESHKEGDKQKVE